MSRNRVYVELVNGYPIRIFRGRTFAVLSPAYAEGRVGEWPKKDAVAVVRKIVFERSQGECERCGEITTERSGEMHEMVPRGHEGEVSVENSWFICNSCHTGHKDSFHGNRRWGGKQ